MSNQIKPATVRQYTIEQFMASTRLNGASFSADEQQVLFSSDATGIFNAYTLPISSGQPKALTTSQTDTTFAVSYFHEDDRILYTRDNGGDENNHLYVRELDGSERDLTPGDKLKATFLAWRPDGAAFHVLTNEIDPKCFDLYRYDTYTYARTLLYKNELAFEVVAISRDEQWIALGKPNTVQDSDIYLHNLGTGETRHITPHQGNVSSEAATFDPTSMRLFFLTDEGREFKSLCTYNLATGEIRGHEAADWDVVFTYYSRDGRYRVTGVNNDGSTTIRIVEGPDERPVPLPPLPAGDILQLTFSKTSAYMAFYVNSDLSPSNLFTYEFATGQVRQLTQSLSAEIDPKYLVDGKVVRFKSFDGMVIPSIYYQPHGASAGDSLPAMVYVHGGPGGQTRHGFNPTIQYLVNHGYAVLGINNRGSSGYGKTFRAADDRKHGREPLWDCVQAKTWLASLGCIDPSRIGIMGGSYGGYMTLAALAFRPESFKAGIDMFGISNWVRTLESMPPYWESFRKVLYEKVGHPVNDREMLIATSPLFHATAIRAPLLVIQGANDPRVIKTESDEIVEAVKKNGVPVKYLLFADEGHGFSKKKNQVEANRLMLEFLDRYMN
jgi:dipeptidyl aminopeptidase/acylaminoacyl peptidase